jgi:hypothetical protein
MFRSRALIIGFGILVVLALVGLFLPKEAAPGRTANAAKGWQPDARGVAMAKLLSVDDFTAYIAGNRSVVDWGPIQPIEKRVTAAQLYSAYTSNEVAADDQFNGKTIALNGTLRKISKNMFNNVYLVMDGGGYLRDVQAFLSNAASAEASQLRPGKEISLICTGAGMVLTSPIVKQCECAELVIRKKRAGVERTVDEVLRTDSAIAARTKLLIGYSYVVGTALPKGGVCESATPDDMLDCREAMGGLARDMREQLYDKFAKQHNFPPRPKS